MPRYAPCHVNPLTTHGIYSDGNMESITETIPINISRTPSIMERIFVAENCSPEDIQIYIELFKEFYIIFSWYFEDMIGIDPHIIEHEMTSYPYVKHVRQKLRLISSRKAAMIKAEVEKLIKYGFIYVVQFIELVSYLIPLNENKGTIHICMEFQYLNKSCPKDNFPTPFIDQIIDQCAGCEVFYFMDTFFRYK
jgi:hypothetical protein